MKKLFAIFCFVLFTVEILNAQKDFPHDTSYYETFPQKITGRIFLSQKYVHLNFPAKDNNLADME
ncbi:MAG: hypothetical protein JJE22_17785, partial [Bacteroidia bacterium]|nr:hypothetical protein [Bacteroidia bacterium]